jgi:uncharacterized integral membrane protein
MLRTLAGLLWLAAGLVLVLFAVANRGLVAVSFDPFADDAALRVRLPLFLVVFIAVVVGVILGAVAERVRSRRQARNLQLRLRRRDEEARRAAGEGTGQLPAPR